MSINEKTPGVTSKLVGSGLTKRHRHTIDLNKVGDELVQQTLAELGDPPSWEWHLTDWRQWLNEQMLSTLRCPGREDERCCGVYKLSDAENCSPTLACEGGNWRELEDLEWFYRDANRLYGIVQRCVVAGNASGAAKHGIELGERLIQIEMKLGPEAAWRTGRQIRAGLDERREAANHKRHNESIARQGRWQSEADKIWHRNPSVTKSSMAGILVKKGFAEGQRALSEQCGTLCRALLAKPMPRKSRALPPSPFRRFNSSPEVIRLVVMMYVRFPLSLRNVEDLLIERGIDICHETVRFWWNRFGPLFAADIRRHRVSRMKGFRHWKWHLDEVYVKINGEMHYLWRAVDQEGEILESFVTKSRDKKAALRFMKKALKRHGQAEAIVTDGLKSYAAAMRDLGNIDRREVGRWANNRAENSHLPFRRRERAMLRFRQMKSLQKFASVHANVHNHFNLDRHLNNRQTYKTARSAALAEWQNLMA